MCTAYQATSEDVQLVLESHADRIAAQSRSLDELAEQLFDGLDCYAIERAALKGGTDLEEQTAAADAEILRQLVEGGHIRETAA